MSYELLRLGTARFGTALLAAHGAMSSGSSQGPVVEKLAVRKSEVGNQQRMDAWFAVSRSSVSGTLATAAGQYRPLRAPLR